ncbi:hypothetical protein SAMN05444422_102376 [Halobiforma haloterrestris]|uniref:Uncharacterized protein n=1 Tax=Natronobacterium haloterrestre TaxID=148448 RepID=A0A1I1ECT9_NATHA|nr:hypothetical protein [Halobiforma haloterrestris]SFB84905.1 hypothetical protein SAMN05444422_102376 [Halobiforma haloterrestris]
MPETDTTRRRLLHGVSGATIIALAGCLGGDGDGSDGDAMDDGSMDDSTDDTMAESTAMDPSDAPRAEIDRFSEDAGTLMVRDETNDLPEPDAPIDFDQGPFVTQGFGPDGEPVEYYNFDVQPTDPAPIYAFFRENGDPVEDQLNVVGVVPGDEGYNDFWHVHRVTVPDDYEANAVTSAAELMDGDFEITPTETIKNCPIVPDGSRASKRYGYGDGDGDGDQELVEGWYDGTVVSYFLFEERPLEATDDGTVPTTPIYVSFDVNPDEDGGGPQSGFMTEEMSEQTHNVVASLPEDEGYSPLWTVTVYDNEEFGDVSDLESATDATVLETDTATVNCPVVSGGMG